jgi:DNA mismatch repair protein MutL
MSEEKNRIQLLSDAVIDQIAAGEVVERPASVVKELVENALDAGAGRIRVDVRDGGRAFVAVTDDGCGMSPRESRMALARHATSKLESLSDLESVASFGFRGEAIPAIASVSKLRLFTRPNGADEGYALTVDNSEILSEKQAGGPQGTRVEVAELFAKIPARRKFLKSQGTEWGHIADWMRRLALVLPGVHFELRRDDRAAHVWPATADPLDRIAAVLGEAEAAALVEVQCEEGAGHLHAFVSNPEHSRANANGIYLFVNGRPVRDKVMRHALSQAYRDILPRGRFPSAILFLTLRGTGLDVNVHPAKWEVRFAEPQAVHQLIRRAVRGAMVQRGWLAEGSEAGAEDVSESGSISGREPGQSQREHQQHEQHEHHQHHRGKPGDAGHDASWVRDREASDWVLAGPATGSRGAGAPNDWTPPEVTALPGLDAPSSEPASTAVQFGSLRLLGQLLASYLLLEGKEGLLLVDQHAAHERVLYERLRAEWLDRGVERQGLLLAADVELDPLDAAALGDHGEIVERLGFEIEPFGEGAVVVRSAPSLLGNRDPATLVRELAAELRDLPTPTQDTTAKAAPSPDDTRLLAAADRVFASLACHSARRAGDHLEPSEQRQILKDLDTIPWAPTCPHGRPVAAAYSLPEIERRFSRR